MKTCNSISGGKTSAYLAANYPADYNIFALVTTNDKNCLYPDAKLRQRVSDKIGREFIGTLEMDDIIHTIFDLEQYIGKEINWVAGITFDDVVDKKGGWLPNKLHRYCTTNMKLDPMFHFWHKNSGGDPWEMRIGFRANETRRANNMLERLNENGLLEIKQTVSKHPNGKNKWENFEWQKPAFPLIDDQVYKDQIVNYWTGKPVRFATHNNCVGCFHRNPVFLKKMSEEHPNKFDWFVDQEKGRREGTWRTGITYEQIKKHRLQLELSLDDFSECDSGYCGL